MYNEYEVVGKHKDTHRKRTIKLKAKTEELAEKQALNEYGLVPPLQITLVPPTPATEKQISYAKSLGTRIPEGATIYDTSYIIDSALDNDSPPNPEFMEFAEGRDLLPSNYIGKKKLYNYVFDRLTGNDKTAFFVFAIYRYLSEDRRANLDKHPDKDVFYLFAEEVKDDDAFLKSMNRYGGESLRFFGKIKFNDGGYTEGGSTNSIAYKKVAEYLHNLYNTPLTKIITFHEPSRAMRETASTATKNSGCGCFTLIMFFTAVMILVFYVF